MAADDIRLPLVGEVPKKAAIGGAAVAVVIVVIVIMRQRNAANAAGAANASSASASGESGMVTDPAGNQCAALDPGSGYCPGSPQDQAYQEQAAYGGVSDYGGEGYGEYGTGYVTDPAGNQCIAIDPATGYCPGYNPVGAAGTGPGEYTTNDEWLEAAMSDVPGDQATIQAALAAVLGGLTVTTAQKNLFLEAVGINGQPPQGYPQPIKTSDTSGQPAPVARVTVPNVIGQEAVNAQQNLGEVGLKSTLTGPAFKAGLGGVRQITAESPKQGTKVNSGSSVKLTYKIVGNQKPAKG
jgi:PASTA domain